MVIGDEEGTPEDTLEFELKVKCSWNPARTKDHTNPEDLYRDFRGKQEVIYDVFFALLFVINFCVSSDITHEVDSTWWSKRSS